MSGNRINAGHSECCGSSERSEREHALNCNPYPDKTKDRIQDIVKKEPNMIIYRMIMNHKTKPKVLWSADCKRYCREARPKVKQKERRVDALALRADEGRDKLRKASGRSKYPLIRRYPNGETRQGRPLSSVRQSITCGREPPELKHLSRARKRKKHRLPK